eukprot:TRINITY_DN1895_c2_g1_i1.p1 TRINITY_DN1895_c2_g1~~TRINITY_DN1895_c2_g1_i1.p1  ORF type:complete len:415 (+),score=109.66 TRINITY_DN1895_c2_g1_i1:69-1247(+)
MRRPPMQLLAGAAVLLGASAAVECAATTTGAAPLPRALPQGGIVAAYADWGACNAKVEQAARDGANVIIWFTANLVCSPNGSAVVAGPLPDMDCVARVARGLRDSGLRVTHLMSVGGWNAPHPCTDISAAAWAREWHRWNTETVARPGFESGFDGLDWDLEGNDDPRSPSNLFTVQVLDLMGELAVQLKSQFGYITAMAPAQSYLDESTAAFDLRATLPPHEPSWHQDFTYHGRNQYAYVLAKVGVGAFDFVSVQLYEGWSQADYEVTPPEYGGKGVAASEYVARWVRRLQTGWEVDFGGLGGLHKARVSIPRERLIVGLANGWATRPSEGTAGDGKFLLLWPEEVKGAWRMLGEQRPRGAMFWSAQYEGDVVEGTKRTLTLASDLAAFVRT